MPWSEHIQHSDFIHFWDYARVLSSHFEHKQGQRSQTTFEPLFQCLNTLTMIFFLPCLSRICLVPFTQFQSADCSSSCSPHQAPSLYTCRLFSNTANSQAPALGWLCWDVPPWLVRFPRITELSEGSGGDWKLHEGPHNEDKWSLQAGILIPPLSSCFHHHCWGSRSGASLIWNMKHYKCTLPLSLWNTLGCLRRKPSLLRRSGWKADTTPERELDGRSIFLLKKFCLESVKGRREMLGVLYPPSREQKVHKEELEGKTDLQ